MTSKDKRLLLSQTSRLTTLGKRLDDERQKLKALVGQGVAYDSPEVLATLENCERLCVNSRDGKHLC